MENEKQKDRRERAKSGERRKRRNIVKGRERKIEQGDKLRDKFELLLSLLSATARIQDSVNYAPKCFIIKHFAVLIVTPTATEDEKTSNALGATRISLPQ